MKCVIHKADQHDNSHKIINTENNRFKKTIDIRIYNVHVMYVCTSKYYLLHVA